MNEEIPIIEIDQSTSNLIGYQAFYKDGDNRFYEELDLIVDNVASNPLVKIAQVGILKA